MINDVGPDRNLQLTTTGRFLSSATNNFQPGDLGLALSNVAQRVPQPSLHAKQSSIRQDLFSHEAATGTVSDNGRHDADLCVSLASNPPSRTRPVVHPPAHTLPPMQPPCILRTSPAPQVLFENQTHGRAIRSHHQAGALESGSLAFAVELTLHAGSKAGVLAARVPPRSLLGADIHMGAER